LSAGEPSFQGEVGFVGLGAMGSEIALRLLEAGIRLRVFDTRAEAMAPLLERGAAAESSPAAVADSCGVVLVSLPTPDVVRAVVTGPEGLLEGEAMRVFGDLSTTGREVAQQLGATLAERGVSYLDAPLSGGVAGAEKGTLGVFVAADDDVFERCRPLLEPFAGTIVRVGDEPGHGQVAKLLNNLLSAAAFTITSEAMALGVREGLRPEALLEAFNSGTGRNTATTTKFPNQVLNRRFATGFRLELMLKDVRLCLDEARAQRVPMPLGSTVEQLWLLGAATAPEGADQTAMAQLFEDWAGVTIAASEASADV
jgi:3-hydroxyisobutyrate dehydrogenase-like beta-hydroxyacid dehydrogenase